MAFTVETGSGVAGANSYLSTSEADSYHTDRGNSAWAAASSANRQMALIKASAYIDANYRWSTGRKATSAQGLLWPRNNSFDLDGFGLAGTVPQAVKYATAELALRALTVELQPDIERQVSSVKLGPIDVTFVDGAAPNTRFDFIDRILSGLVVIGAGVEIMRG